MSNSSISRRRLLTSVAMFALLGSSGANAKGHSNGVFITRENLKIEGDSVLVDNKNLSAALSANRNETIKFLAESFKVNPRNIEVDRAGRVLIKGAGIGPRVGDDFTKVKNGACGFGC